MNMSTNSCQHAYASKPTPCMTFVTSYEQANKTPNRIRLRFHRMNDNPPNGGPSRSHYVHMSREEAKHLLGQLIDALSE